MAQQQQRENSGVLFKNETPKKSERHPDYSGSINVGGQEFWLDAWIKKGQKGAFMSLSVKPKNAAPAKQAQRAKPTAAANDSDCPF